METLVTKNKKRIKSKFNNFILKTYKYNFNNILRTFIIK